LSIFYPKLSQNNPAFLRVYTKSAFFVDLSWTIDMWAQINDVKLSQSEVMCHWSPSSPHHKRKTGRNSVK